MKVIFLDVDGELTYSGYSNASTLNIDYEKIKLLKEIVYKTNAVIVLSSSWRNGHDKETGEKRNFYKVLEKALNDNGLYIYEDLLDIKTTHSSNYINSISLEDLENSEIDHSVGRAVEIKIWLEKNKPESFVILDDEDYDWKYFGLDKNWIQPSWYDENGGLQKEHVDESISILNKTDNPIKPMLMQLAEEEYMCECGYKFYGKYPKCDFCGKKFIY